jgi:hypothetical protein
MTLYGPSVAAQPRHLGRYGIQELDVGGIFDHGLWLLKDNVKYIVILSLLFSIPLDIINSLIFRTYIPESPEELAPMDALLMLAGGLGTQLVYVGLAYPIIIGPMTVLFLQSYLGHEPSVSQCIKRGLKPYFRLLVVIPAGTAVYVIGLAFCVLPGILFSVFVACVTEVIIVENGSIVTAFERSFRLTAKSFFPALVVSVSVQAFEISCSTLFSDISPLWLYLPINAVGAAAMDAFSCAVSLPLYFSMRCRSEAHDLELLAMEVDGSILPQGATL